VVYLQGHACGSKKYKPLCVDEPHQDYYHMVTPSDEAFGFFCLKNYKDFTSFSKWKKEKKGGEDGDDDDEESKTRKEKLCGRKLLQAIAEYDDWHRKFMEIRKNKKCLLVRDIKSHCQKLEKNKQTEGHDSGIRRGFLRFGDAVSVNVEMNAVCCFMILNNKY